MKHLIFVPVLALLASNAHAQDVYNFYFQKTDHANEMVQVKNGEPVAASKSLTAKSDGTSTTASTTTAPALATGVEAPEASSDKPTKWRLGFGIASLTDHARRMSTGTYGLMVGYSFNKYFGVEGQALYGRANYASDYGVSGASSDGFAGALGAKLTPVHIDLFGWDFIDIAVNGGVMTTQGSEDDASRTTRLVPYVGGEVALNITRNSTLALDGKFENGDSKFGQMTFSGIIKF